MSYKRRKWRYPTHCINEVGESRSNRIYNVWATMVNRCTNKKRSEYKYYGGRGIKVCDEWLNYDNFYEWAYFTGYNEDAKQGVCTLDRIDTDGNYEPSNCRWVTMKIQQRNRRNNVKINDKLVIELSEISGLTPETIKNRNANGVEDLNELLKSSTIIVEGKTLMEISKESGIPYGRIRKRYYSGKTSLDGLLEERNSTRDPILVDGKTLREISKETGITIKTLQYRYGSGKVSYEELTSNKLKQGEHPARIYINGKTLREISEESGVNLVTIKQRYKDGKRSYEELIKDVRKRGR
jgi:hypothetical protein